MTDFLFLQVSTNLINKDVKKDVADVYYSGIYQYKNKDGYFKPSEFWEIPLWIAEICGSFKDFKKELYVIKDISQAKKDIEHKKSKYILCSILEVNKAIYYDIIKNYKGDSVFLIGGYIDFSEFKKLQNVIVFDTIKSLTGYFKRDYIYAMDYSLFKGLYTIPRLVLSTGCLNRCKFCTIEKELKEKTLLEVIRQCLSFTDLNFKLVYINDKTYGQAKNYVYLKYAFNVLKKINPNFEGFIIQTTATQILQKQFKENLKYLHVKIAEIGVETFNNEILRELKKPHNTAQILEAMKILKNNGIKFIANIVIGFIQETAQTYKKTLQFISEHQQDIYLLNVYNLAIYKETELFNEIQINNADDLNELKQEKSFYNAEAVQINGDFYNQIFKIGIELLRKD